MGKAIKGILVTLGMLALVLVIGAALLLAVGNYRNKNYWKYADPGGDVEKKYSAMGEYEVSFVSFDAENEAYQKYEIWYPSEMKNENKQYPLVIMVNGTGVKASKYKEVFRHLASWGFIVAGNEDENARTGASSAATLDFVLERNRDSDSEFYGKIDTQKIGIGGHSQGGVGAINAVTAQENGGLYKAIYAASTTSPYWGQDNALGKEWRYDTSLINIPCFLVAGTGAADAGTAEDITETKGQGISPLWAMKDNYDAIDNSVCKVMARQEGKDHGDILRSADGYMTAWFMYHLQGDEEAGSAFFGNNAELLTNEKWRDAATSLGRDIS